MTRGEVLGTMDDWSWRNQLTAAQAKYEAAMTAMEGDLARHSAEAGEDRTRADYLRAKWNAHSYVLQTPSFAHPSTAW